MSLSQRDLVALRKRVDEAYRPGTFVAIEGGEVVADAASHRDLVEALKSLGKTPKDMLILEAGADLPQSVVILLGTTT